MAQVLTENNIPDASIGMNSVVKEVNLVYEPVASTIGVGANRPYVGIGQAFRATGTAASFGTSGKMEYVAVYADGSEEVIAVPESPNTPNTCLLYTSPSPRD